MTSRERVLATVNHEAPDRVPIDLGGMTSTGISARSYDKLKALVGMRTPTRVLDPLLMIAIVEQEVLKRFHGDVMPVNVPYIPAAGASDASCVARTLSDGTPVLFPPGTRIREEADGAWTLLKPDGTPTNMRMPRDGYYFDDTTFNRGAGIDPARFHPTSEIPEETLRALEEYSGRLYRETDYALLGWGYAINFLGLSISFDPASSITQGQPDEWMMMLMTEKETCHEMMDRAVDAAIKCLGLVEQAAGKYCFAWGVASDDSGTQRGEFISPDLWAEMIKPHYTRLCSWVHSHSKMKTFMHSCGSIPHLIPHLIEAGIDIINPVQTSAAGMDPATLKRQFGDKIVFWGGGCDTQSVLPNATPEEVKKHVKERLGIFAPGGGFTFSQVHNIQAKVPPENILAMLEAAFEYGGY